MHHKKSMAPQQKKQEEDIMEQEAEIEMEMEEPLSPTAMYLKSSKLSLTVLAVMESETPIDDTGSIALIRDLFLPINPRFSSIMVEENERMKKWKRVSVKLEDHVKVPEFPAGMTPEYYGECFTEYLSKIAAEPFPENRPLWEIHIVKYPTNDAAGNIVFKLHHSLGDGYSLMGALLSCLKRFDDPNLPLTLPSRQSAVKGRGGVSFLRRARRLFQGLVYTPLDFVVGVMKSSFLIDDTSPIRSGEAQNKPIVTATTTLSIDEFKKITSKLSVTINDVLTGVIILGTRLYMQQVDQESKKSTTTALVLLNTRALQGYKSIDEMIKPKSKMPWGNRFAFLHVPIPKVTSSELQNPLCFVTKARKMIKRQRSSGAVYLTGQLLNLIRKLRGSDEAAKYIHGTLQNTSLAISNLIGPVEKMALDNKPVKGLYFVVNGPPQSVSVTVMSYVRSLRVAITVEKGFIDQEKYKACIEYAFKAVFNAALQL